MDSKSGVARSVAEHRQLDGVYGAITTAEDPIIQNGCFHYWFDIPFDKKAQEFPISFLLKHQEAIKFEGLSGDGKEIRISLLFKTSKGTPYQDFRTIWLDPQRGFTPVRMHRRWEFEATAPGATPLYSELDTEVKEMKQVDGVWFPTHFTETCVGRTSVADGYATVYETTVGRIKLGAMTDDDLQVHFADGVQVHDRIKGVWFVATEETQSAPPASEPGAPGRARKWPIFVGIAILALLAILALRARGRKFEDAPGR
jgi:hypothetical protein